MVTTPTATNSSADRPVNLRWRPDVRLRRQKYNGQTYWVAKDPLSLKYFRFSQLECFIVRQLDGKTSLGEMQRRFQDEFAPQVLSLHDLLSFLGQLHQSGLTISDSPGQGDFLWQRRDKANREKWRRMLTNPFAIRLPAFDPQRMLDRLYPAVRFFFSSWTVAAGLLVMVAALVLVLSRLDEFRSRSVGLSELLSVENWGWLALAIAGTKILHEFGHALTARHFRCECHEMGVMLLCFTPAVYTNVTDAWILPNKWSRIAISAAGIYVELLIAAVATFVWWFTAPGAVHQLAMILMLTCSLQTFLANANPLMRFDGYFVLADWLEIPNLRAKARRLLLNWLSEACLGIEPPPDQYLPVGRRILFAVYAVTAVLYGWLVFYIVLAFLVGSFLPREARWVGLLLATMLLWHGLISPLIRFHRWLMVPGRIQQIHPPKLIVFGALSASLLIALCTIPTQETLSFPIELQPRRSGPVVDRDHWEARWPVPPRALPRLRIGQSATVRIVMAPESKFTGTVTHLARQVATDSPSESGDLNAAAWIATVGLGEAPRNGLIGGRGWVRISVSRRSWGRRAWHAVWDLIAGESQ